MRAHFATRILLQPKLAPRSASFLRHHSSYASSRELPDRVRQFDLRTRKGVAK